MQRDAETAASAVASAGTATTTTTTTTTIGTEDATKRALLARFAYEAPDEDGEDANDDAQPVLTNRQVAAQAAQDAAAEMRGKSVQTKKEERVKTAAAKQSKVQAKEERRQRATKGERKR
jgi:hypothetical protein